MTSGRVGMGGWLKVTFQTHAQTSTGANTEIRHGILRGLGAMAADRRGSGTFEESLDGFVHAVLKMLQHQNDLVVALVGDDGPDGVDL